MTLTEVHDLVSMMDNTELCEMDGVGNYFTWTNNQVDRPIYSRIDRVLVNTSWFQQHLDTILHIQQAGISDHVLLWLRTKDNIKKARSYFKFYNCVTDLADYNVKVQER